MGWFVKPAVVIAVQLSASYWFYLYIAWFVPLALPAMMGAHSNVRERV